MSELFKRLDEIEALEPSAATDEEVLDLMERDFERTGDIDSLLRRYGSSENPVFCRSLSFLLTRQEAIETSDAIDRLLLFAKHLKCVDDESTLINCFTAIQKGLITGGSRWISSADPDILFSFVMSSLDHSDLVRRGVISLLSLLHQHNLIASMFSTDQIEGLRKRLKKTSLDGTPMLQEEMKGLSNFINT